MKAVFIRRYGKLDALEYGDRPEPVPTGRQVLIDVHAASVNPRDWLIREGRYVFRHLMVRLPQILGSDVSGVVAATGPLATRFTVGDAVFGMQTPLGGFGGYAERVAMDERVLARKPAEVSHEEAAAVPCAGLTAWDALVKIGRVWPGAKVTIVGASGGVGSYAVQLGKALGATVTGVTSTPNVELVRSLGADTVVDYKTGRFTDSVRGQDLVFDVFGRESLSSASRVLASGGRFVTTIPNGRHTAQAVTSRLWRLVTFGKRPSAHIVLVRTDGANLARIAGLMAEGRVKSVIDTTFPLAEARAAHERSRSWRTRGKLVLRVR